MNAWRWIILLTGVLPWAGEGQAAEPVRVAVTETWWGNLSNSSQGTEAELSVVLTAQGTALTGTVVVGEARWPAEGVREGAWLELNWKEADGRQIQVRGVLKGGELRGTFIAGGNGRLIEYGRCRLVLEAKPEPRI